MAVNREYRCKAHNHEFESREGDPENAVVPPCPFGCSPSFVVLEFRTPVSTQRGKTRVIDHFQRQLAQDYNMTDMRGDKDGTSVMSNTSHLSGGARMFSPEKKTKWAPSLFQPQQGWAQQADTPPPSYKHDLPGNTTKMEPILKGAPPLMAKTVMVRQKGEK
jgi:hypothetical protein